MLKTDLHFLAMSMNYPKLQVIQSRLIDCTNFITLTDHFVKLPETV